MRVILESKPDVALLETELPGRGVFDVAAELSRRLKETKIVFLTGYVSEVFIDHALRVNARGCLLKSEPVDSTRRWNMLLVPTGNQLKEISSLDGEYPSRTCPVMYFPPNSEHHLFHGSKRCNTPAD